MALMKADPDYVSSADGLLIRMNAFAEILQNWLILLQAIGIQVVIMILEMGGLLTAFFLTSAGVYATRTASDINALKTEALETYFERISESLGRSTEARLKSAESRAAMRRAQQRERNDSKTAEIFNAELEKMKRRGTNQA